MAESFSVALFFPDDTYRYEGRWLDAEEAVNLARECTGRPAAMAGWIWRVIITDADDFTVFEWKAGEGVTYPGREQTGAADDSPLGC
jgi:hypothetical protein